MEHFGRGAVLYRWPSLSRKLSAGALKPVCVMLAVLCLGSTWALAATGSSLDALWVNSLVQSLFFAAGALLSLQTDMTKHVSSYMLAIPSIVGGFGLWFGAEAFGGIKDIHHRHGPSSITLGYAVVSFGCAMILFGFLHLPDKIFPRPLLYLGRISYGLYVFHFLVRMTLQIYFSKKLHFFEVFTINLLLTIVLAAISYELIEKPFLKLKGRFEIVKTRAI